MKNYIVMESEGGLLAELAAKDLRRYLHVLGEDLPVIVEEIPKEGNTLILAVRGSSLLKQYKDTLDYAELGEEGYLILGEGNRIVLTGKSHISVLYAVYRFLEWAGIQFCLHNDVVPDRRKESSVWEQKIYIKESPIFSERGILPFHDFPEGPDWWNKDDYYVILTQLSKMRGNFFALHTYPENQEAPKAMTAEPLVWIGKKEDCNEDGTVKASYPIQHFKTNGNSWGYHPMKTRDYPCSTGNVFEKDCYGPDYMDGYEEEIYSEELHENDVAADKYNKMFEQYGNVLSETFSYAREIGVKTCIGTEAPLTIPEVTKKHLGIGKEADRETIESLYEGIFERIKRTHPLDYYWMWTPEDWTWLGNTKEETEKTIRDFSCALEAKEKTQAPFELAVCGWTLGPQENRAAFDNYLPKTMPFSCINRNVGFDPIEPKFQDLEKRSTWAIPWLEDDPAMISPQLWVGRTRRDAFDAKRYGCDGLLGIHWRTSSISPNIKALMESAWTQSWAKDMPEEICLEGYIGGDSFIEKYMSKEGILSTARKNLEGYSLKIAPGNYTVSLIFQCESVKMDIKIKNRLLKNITVNSENQKIMESGIEVEQDTCLAIKFMAQEGIPALAAIIIEGKTKNNQLNGNDFCRKINCGGTQWEDYEADLPLLGENGRHAPAEDFYHVFARAEFGDEAGEKAAEILARQDGDMPRPSRWEDGPGNIYCNEIPWEDMQEQYRFVDEFEGLSSMIKGKGSKERHAYWNHMFQAMKRTAQIGCLWGEFEKYYNLENDKKMMDTYGRLIKVVEELEYHLLMSLQTYGDMGVLTNIQQRSVIPILKRCREKLLKWYSDIPVLKENVVEKASKLVVPTVRTTLKKGENFSLKIIVIGGSDSMPVLKIRNLGSMEYKKLLFEKKERWVYSVKILAKELKEDFEYHISLQEDEKCLRFPNNDLYGNQTVIVLG